MSKELESLKKKRRFLRKNLTDTLKLVEEELHTQDNHARIQVLKDSIASKWNDLKDIQGAMCALLDDEDIDEECKQHSEWTCYENTILFRELLLLLNSISPIL